MGEVQHCCVCLELYNNRTRQPLLLPCNHRLCSTCLSTKAISSCPLCRTQLGSMDIPLPVDQQLLTAINVTRAASPSSFPIGLLLDDSHEEGAPGTPPHPSAPTLAEIQACDTDAEDGSRSLTGSVLHSSSCTGSMSSSSGGGSSCSNTALQDRAHAHSSRSCWHRCKGTQPALAALHPAGELQICRSPGTSHASHADPETDSRPAGAAPMNAPQGVQSYSLQGDASTGAAALEVGSNSRHEQQGNVDPRPASGSNNQGVLSFPVDDFGDDQDDASIPDSPTLSPRPWPGHVASPGAAHAAVATASTSSASVRDRSSPGVAAPIQSHSRQTSVAAVHMLAGGTMRLLQLVAVPWRGLMDHAAMPQLAQQGPMGLSDSPMQQPSIVLAAVHNSMYCWASYSAALQHCLSTCLSVQSSLQAAIEALLQRVGVSGYGQLAWYWAVTWAAGLLLYHRHLGMQLLLVAASSLVLCVMAHMRAVPCNDSHSGRLRPPGSHAHSAPRSFSGCGGRLLDAEIHSRSVAVWPARAAGSLLAADCLVLGVLLCMHQQFGVGLRPLLGLLSVTPVAASTLLLLLFGQVVLGAIRQQQWNYRELQQASLLCRCWCIAAAGVLAAAVDHGSVLSMLAAAAAWAQKAHMAFVEGPLLVLRVAALFQPRHLQAGTISSPSQLQRVLLPQQMSTASTAPFRSRTSRARCSSPEDLGLSLPGRTPAATPTAPAQAFHATSASSCLDGGVGAPGMLCCLHLLVQALVLLYVPPAPLAAAMWLWRPLQLLMVWGARVLFCGIAVQLAVQVMCNSYASSAAARRAPCSGANGVGQGCHSPTYDDSVGDTAGLSVGSPQGRRLCLMAPASPACGGISPQGPGAACGWQLQTRTSSRNSNRAGTSRSSRRNAHLADRQYACVPADRLGSAESAGCSSWALTRAGTPSAPPLDYSCVDPVASRLGGSASSAAAATVSRLVLERGLFLVVLLAAVAGDVLITTAAMPNPLADRPGMLAATADRSAAGLAARLIMRTAWQQCLQWLMVAGLCLEVVVTAGREWLLLLGMPHASPPSCYRGPSSASNV